MEQGGPQPSLASTTLRQCACVHAYADDVLQSSEFRCRRRAQTETAADRTHLFVDCLGTVQIRAVGRLAATSAGPGHAVRLA